MEPGSLKLTSPHDPATPAGLGAETAGTHSHGQLASSGLLPSYSRISGEVPGCLLLPLRINFLLYG